jgi:hypothetical protein
MTGQGWFVVLTNAGRFFYSEVVAWAVTNTSDRPDDAVVGLVVNPKGGSDLVFADTLGVVKTYARNLEHAQVVSSQYQNGTLK